MKNMTSGMAFGDINWGRQQQSMGGNFAWTPGTTVMLTTSTTTGGTKPVLAQVIRYVVVPKNDRVVKVLGNKSILLTGQSVVIGADLTPFYVDIGPNLTTALEVLNQDLKGKTWVNADGIVCPFETQVTSDLDVVLEVIKKY